MKSLGIIASSGVLLAGCYSLEPARGVVPEMGRQVAFDITDVGRVGLGGAMGPEIAQVEGRLVSRDNGEYVVAVSGVHMLKGGYQTWTGEQVHLKDEYVSTAYVKEFSKSRTAVAGALGVSAFAFILTRSLTASGTEDQQTPGKPVDTYRAPRP
ncbi:MAG: hypothetical protein JWM95_1303 [Gemmatimonadetes bacterium]|nr:hypothetical protein [Gemmatimonadota bacterium]